MPKFLFISHLTEIDKAILLATLSGLLGGFFQGILHDVVGLNQQNYPRNLGERIKLYVYYSLTSSVLVGIIAFLVLIYDDTTPIENINHFSLYFGIVGLPFIAIMTDVLESFVKKTR